MKRIVTRLLALGALLSGGGLAASGCTSLYAATVTGGTSRLEFVNTLTGGVSTVFTAPTTITNINGVALNPVTGDLYYFDRSAATTNNLYVYDPQDGTNTQLAAIPLPATGAVVVGSTFDNSTGTPRLFVLYNNYQVQEITLGTTPSVARTLSISFTGSGLNKTSQTVSSTTTTSGDILFVGSTLYASLDAETATAGSVYYVTLGTPPTTGTTGTLTVTSPVQLKNGAATFAPKSVNGIAINGADNSTYISHTSGGTFIAKVSPSTGAVTNYPSITNSPTDLSDCNNVPDAPTISKMFSRGAVTLSGGARVTLTVGNTNPSPFYLQSALTDTLPAGLVVAAVPNAATTCTNADGTALTPTADAQATTASLPAATRVPAGGCTFSFDVTSTSTGSKVNTIPVGGVVSTSGNNAAAASATLTVNAGVTGTLVKTQRNVTQVGTATQAAVNARPGDVIEYCLTATHPGAGTADATVANLKDTLNADLTALRGVYSGKDVQLTRGATVTGLTFAAGDDAATLSGQTLTVSLLPFGATNAAATVCFRAQVRNTRT